MSAVTNYHELGGLKQHAFILQQFWRSELQNRFYEAEARGWQGRAASGAAKGEDVCLLF